MTLPASPVDTATGVRSAWAYAVDANPVGPNAAIPAGALVSHNGHAVSAMWAGDTNPDDLLTLESLVPLTVAEPFRCPLCGIIGTITDGVYTVLDDGTFTPITEDGA